MSVSSWPALFSNPLFRKGWRDSRSAVAPTEGERDSVVYLFGRLMSAESKPAGVQLPPPRDHLIHDMIEVIKACPAFADQMVAAQWLQAHGDPAHMTEPLGTKQGDQT